VTTSRSSRIARKGEGFIENLCHETGLTVNESNLDEHGWDLVVEFSPDDLAGDFVLPLDKYPQPKKFFLQVKATDDATGAIDVKLSSFRRFALLGAPCFFVVVDFDGKDEVQDIYVVHVGEELLRHLLRRLRKTKEEEKDSLNRKTMTFRYEENHALEELSGECFRQRLLAAIREHQGNYENWKQEIYEYAGYEGESIDIKAEVDVPPEYADSPEDFWIDHVLGLTQEADIKRAEIHDTRFGIESSTPIEVIPGGALEVRALPEEATLVFSRNDEGQLLQLPCEVTIPPQFGDEEIPSKFRIDIGFGEIVAETRSDQARLGLNFPSGDENIPLREHKRTADLVLLFHKSANKEQPLKLSLRRDGEMELLSRIDFDGSTFFGDIDISTAQTVVDAWAAAKYFDLQSEVEVKGAELIAQENTVKLLSALATPTPDLNRGKVWVKRTPDDDPESDTNDTISVEEAEGVVCVRGGDIVLGSYRVVFFIGFFGKPEPIDESIIETSRGQIRAEENEDLFVVDSDRVRIIDHLILERGASLPSSVPQMLHQAGEKVAGPKQVVIPVLRNA
jgi:hypothetical protein